MKFKTLFVFFLCNFIQLCLLASVEKIKNFNAFYEKVLPLSDIEVNKQDQHFWKSQGIKRLTETLKEMKKKPKNFAKNVIIFVGDGMGVTTATAARIYKGQRRTKRSGEEFDLSFDKFPHVALVKTYNVDKQVPDSAGTATALFTGIKARYNSIAVDVNSKLLSFDKNIYESSKLDSIMVWAQEAGKHTGIVTTTRITHATPAATYARINNREWECDTQIPEEYRKDIKDIARQLIEDKPGKDFKVILGGGQQQMGYVNSGKPNRCSRGDNLNLTKIWLENHENFSSIFAVNNEGLAKVTDDTEYLLGLFDVNHMPFELIRNKSLSGTPSLTDMTKKALQVLKKNSKGFVLMVEGGLIDQAHHKNFARLAMEETSEFDNAIELALNETDEDTLILVTSDHSHAFTLNGYAKRGNDILEFGSESLKDFPYYTLAYGNGPGFHYHFKQNDTPESFPWRNVFEDENRYTDPWYQHLATFPREDETHGGEDVPIYAKGPCSHLINGVVEQNYVAYVISYAACIGPSAYLNENCGKLNSRSELIQQNYYLFFSALFYFILLQEY